MSVATELSPAPKKASHACARARADMLSVVLAGAEAVDVGSCAVGAGTAAVDGAATARCATATRERSEEKIITGHEANWLSNRFSWHVISWHQVK